MNRFGIREICDVTFKPLTPVDIGNQHFDAYQPVLSIDTAKTSTLESAVTTVYAQGGKGNPRLIGWDGEKTLTLTIEDALLSPMSFSMLSGAGIVKGREKGEHNAAETIFVHANYEMVVETLDSKLVAKLSDEDRNGATLVVSKEAPIYPITLDSAGAQAEYLSAITEKEVKLLNEDGRTLDEITDALDEHGILDAKGKTIVFILGADQPGDKNQDKAVKAGDTVRIDCYEAHREGAYELQIDAKNFAGYYYIEASTLFRDEATGDDLPAEFVIPRGKIQSNFTFTMAASGDPSEQMFQCEYRMAA